MKEYEIIFYHSGRTAETERLLKTKLSRLGLECHASAAAVSPAELADTLKKLLTACDIAVIIGGLDGGAQSTDSILSMVLSSKCDTLQCEKLVDDEHNLSYWIQAEHQCILVLPDDTEVMEAMLEKRMLSKLKNTYQLSEETDESPSIATVTAELRQQLSNRQHTAAAYSAQIARRQQAQLKRMLLWTVLAFAAGGLLLAAAVLLFLL